MTERIKEAGSFWIKRVLSDAWYSPPSILVTSRGLFHIARHIWREVRDGQTPIRYL